MRVLTLDPDPAILSERREAFRAWLAEVTELPDETGRQEALEREGIEPMPIRDQMRLQLELLAAAVRAVARASGAA